MTPQFILLISKFISYNQLILTIDPSFPENLRLEWNLQITQLGISMIWGLYYPTHQIESGMIS